MSQLTKLDSSLILSSLRGQISEINSRLSVLSVRNEKEKNLNLINRSTINRQLLQSLPRRSQEKTFDNNHKYSRLIRSVDPTSQKEKDFLIKYFNLNNHKPKQLIKSKFTFSRPKMKKLRPTIPPKATRLDPIGNPIKLTQSDLDKGLYSLVNLGLVPKNSEIFETLNRKNDPPLKHSQALFHDFSIQFEPIKPEKKGKIRRKEPLMFTQPDHVVIKTPLLDMSFEKSKPDSPTYHTTDAMETTLENTQVDTIDVEKKKRAKAALFIQSCWRMYKGAARMRRHRIEKAKVDIIQIYYKAYKKRVYTKNFATSLREARSNKFQQRQEHLKSNWKSLTSSNWYELHMSSDLSKYPDPNNSQIFRVFLLTNPKISIIFISLTDIEVEIINYYELLLKLSGINQDNRLTYIIPSTLCSTTMTNASKALYLSSRDLVDLKKLYINKPMLLVPHKTTEYDEFNSGFLNAPILGCLASVFHSFLPTYRIEFLMNNNILTVPGCCGNYTYTQYLKHYKLLTKQYPKRDFEIYINNQKNQNPIPWDDKTLVLIRIIGSYEKICASFFIEPDGNCKYFCSTKLIGNPEFAALYPQDYIDEKEIKDYCGKLSEALYKNKVLGYAYIKITKEGVEDFELGISRYYPVHIFIDKLLKGVDYNGKYYVPYQKYPELEQEVYVDDMSNFIKLEGFEKKEFSGNFLHDLSDERKYMWIWDVHSKDFVGLKMDSIFHMCRLESVLYSLSKNEGTIYLPYSSLNEGCLSLIGIGETVNNILDFIAKGFFILKQICHSDDGNVNFIANELKINERVEEYKEYSENKGYLIELI
ncbi:hypothetical protein SteCoe_24401 [Stentor coeruleus]|uniref:IQ calmodulin-binding motif family protein n=1 Tax=Stentor coeruleus TaxID=5963 RepID=A0A1R2BHL2_9CILI|nr:hypothetical protein SteCoe_24401 [Stentor coeruleus]